MIAVAVRRFEKEILIRRMLPVDYKRGKIACMYVYRKITKSICSIKRIFIKKKRDTNVRLAVAVVVVPVPFERAHSLLSYNL